MHTCKMKDSEVWLVTIDMPLKYINRGLQDLDDIIRRDIDDTNAELEDAFDEEDISEMPPEGNSGDEMSGEMPPEEEI